MAGERDTAASADTIARALEGDYREAHLFTLRQSLDSTGLFKAKVYASKATGLSVDLTRMSRSAGFPVGGSTGSQ